MTSRSRQLLAVLALVTLGACGHGGHGGDAPNDVDRRFVASMVPHHEIGVQMIADAEPRADDVRLRRLVFKMSAYHESELHAMAHHLDEWNLTPADRFPGWVDPAALRELSALTGPDYDVEWLRLMIEHHEGAIVLADEQTAAGAIAELRSLASGIAATQGAEIATMKDLLAELCESTPATSGCEDIAGLVGRG